MRLREQGTSGFRDPDWYLVGRLTAIRLHGSSVGLRDHRLRMMGGRAPILRRHPVNPFFDGRTRHMKLLGELPDADMMFMMQPVNFLTVFDE